MSIQHIRTEWDENEKYEATSCEEVNLKKLTITIEPERSDSFRVLVECGNCPECYDCTFFCSDTKKLSEMLAWILKKPAIRPTWKLPKFIKGE